MRKINTKVRCVKRKLSKCGTVCKTYDEIQTAYADLLENDDEIVSFSCNVPFDDRGELKPFSTDFFCEKSNGDMMVRECVQRSKLGKPQVYNQLCQSKLYWNKRGVMDWGVVIDADKN